jgi:hypothetical protein
MGGLWQAPAYKSHSPLWIATPFRFPTFSSHFNRPATMSGRGKGKTAGKKAVSKSTKAGLQFPVGRIARYLKKGRYAGECCSWRSLLITRV